MEEGNENNADLVQDSAPEQEAPHHEPTSHTELELVFILILVGLLGIAGFIGFMFFSDGELGSLGSDRGEKVEYLTADEIFGMNEEYLGLHIHKEKGQYFTRADNSLALYHLERDGEECLGECLLDFKPYTVSGAVSEGNLFTIERSDSGALQLTWKGRALYTHSKDEVGTAKATDYGDVWKLIRP